MKKEVLCQGSVSTRNLPVNFHASDLVLFEHELKKSLPPMNLLHLNDIVINPDGILFFERDILPESFPPPWLLEVWDAQIIEKEVFWITDTISCGYFHWILDALPRLFMIRERLKNATLLLPSKYQMEKFIEPSLVPFSIQEIIYVHETLRCKKLKIPTHVGVTGNYNDTIISNLREFYIGFYGYEKRNQVNTRIYVSRGKALRRKIVNETECIKILEEFGFKTIWFEDYSFEEQARIASGTEYLVSVHGAGLTNIFLMKPGSSVLEFRYKEDAINNCFFSLASASNLKYYYQLCEISISGDGWRAGDDWRTENIIVDCQLLRRNIEQMLK